MDSTPAQQIRFGDWISEGWKMFTAQWKGWVVMSLGLFCAVAVPMIVFVFFVYAASFAAALEQAGSHAASAAAPLSAFLIFGGFFLLALVMLPLSALLVGGMYRAAFKQLRGGQVEFNDLFSARDRYLPLLGGILLHSLLVGIGSIFCVIPGLIVAGLLFFTYPLIVERKLGVIEAMRVSSEMTKPNLLTFTLFAFLVQLIASAGSIACYVGLLATWPLMFTMTAAAYRDCFGLEGVALPPATEPWSGASYSSPALATNQPASPPPAQPMATVCSNCQASLPATAKFCFRCGTPAPGQ
jgi:uncharacterized membrane protein